MGNFVCFLSSAIFSGLIWIQTIWHIGGIPDKISPKIWLLLGPIWIQTVSKGYPQTILVGKEVTILYILFIKRKYKDFRWKKYVWGNYIEDITFHWIY